MKERNLDLVPALQAHTDTYINKCVFEGPMLEEFTIHKLDLLKIVGLSTIASTR